MAEEQRLKALKATKLLDTEAEPRFDRVTRLASAALGTEVALISLIDEGRQWFKSAAGTDLIQTKREHAFCDHAIRSDDVMVVNDTYDDYRFKSNPLVTNGPKIRFYAGAPLITRDGYALGTLCVIDSRPRRDFSEKDQQILKDLAATIMTEIEVAHQKQLVEDLSVINEELQHRMGNMYAHISALVSMLGRNEDDKDRLVRRLREKISNLGRTQALLAANKWSSVPMSELVRTSLQPFLNSANQGRVDIQTSKDFDVSPRGAFILTLMFTELATNAVKYGALGTREGLLKLNWAMNEDVVISWQETLTKGVPNDISDDTSDRVFDNVTDGEKKEVVQGFGSQILKRIVPMDLQGQADYNLTDSGFSYDVSAKLDRICHVAAA